SFLTNDCAFAKIHHVHQKVLDYELPWYLSKPVKLAEKFSRFYKRVVVPSYTTMDEATNLLKIKRERIAVIPEAVDVEKYRPGEKSPEPFVLWLHRLKKYKNPLTAIKAFDLAREKGLSKDVKLVMAGGGDLEPQVREEAKKRDYVLYLGRVSEEDKVRLLREAWVFLSTSFIEGFGLSILEASASGTPTIAFAVGSLKELVKEGVNGWLVEYGDVNAMAEKIVQAFSDFSTLKKMWETSRKEAEKYSWDRTARMYYDFLKSLGC
ncbi:MAG: glycosyltransferase family 4 protein, partial [Infirmifilum sp.]